MNQLLSSKKGQEKNNTINILNKFGWKIETFHEETKRPINIYCYEPIHTGFASITVNSEDNVKDMQMMIRKDAMLNVSNVCSALNELMCDIAFSQSKSDKFDSLGTIALAYAIQTKTFEHISLVKEDSRHVIIMNYYNFHTKEGCLRPAIVPDKDFVLSPAKLYRACRQIIEMDLRNHPEWFPSAEIEPLFPKM